MGLGLFIAKTLLERSGARIAFANADDALGPHPARPSGAIVTVAWPRAGVTRQGPGPQQG